MKSSFEPRIICFVCTWCTSAAADLAGTSRMEYQPNTLNVRLMCSGRLDPQHILWAFARGADGVFVGGCHPGDCHYQSGNLQNLRRITMIYRLLQNLGIPPERLKLEWISASEGMKFRDSMNEFIDRIRELGPLKRVDSRE
jgi:F420-non-reducing hydrogenase iron-sulfur subunit